MKTELKAKYLQYLSHKKQDEGFTLIELLVVIIIIGILSAIALPSFLNQANKAKESEAKQYVGSMNRAQQAYYLEEGAFADNNNFAQLGLGIKTETQNYQYVIADGGTGATGVTHQAQTGTINPKASVRAYLGAVVIGQQTIAGQGEATTLAVLCGAKQPLATTGVDATASATYKTTGPECPNPTDWEEL